MRQQWRCSTHQRHMKYLAISHESATIIVRFDTLTISFSGSECRQAPPMNNIALPIGPMIHASTVQELSIVLAISSPEWWESPESCERIVELCACDSSSPEIDCPMQGHTNITATKTNEKVGFISSIVSLNSCRFCPDGSSMSSSLQDNGKW